MSDERKEMDKWLITAMSHMKTMYEDNSIPWSEENEIMFQKIRNLIIQQKPEIDRVYVEDKSNYIWTIFDGISECGIEKTNALLENCITQIISDVRGGGNEQ